MAEISRCDLSKVKNDLIIAYKECNQRRLLNGCKWAAELSHSLQVPIDVEPILKEYSEHQDYWKDYDKLALATIYFDLREYDRAALVVENCTSPKAYFLHMYARYLSDEKKKLDNASDSMGPSDNVENENLKILKTELSKKNANNDLDGFGLYLYGVILRKLDLKKDALSIFVQSVNKEPLHWGAWQELSMLISDHETLMTLSLPSHWVRQLFLAHAYLELQLNDEGLAIYHSFLHSGFGKCNYIVSQIAVAYHNMRDVDQAVAAFTELQAMDPHRVDNMDIYSNLLYVKDMPAELADLAYKCMEIDKYRVETCCVVGNYYSLRSQREKSILYFQRALKLNPHYLSAWTLIGHEFMEMKNTSAAIQAYRQAIEVNNRDYRAWYGLGQTYEILKMPSYSLYYHRKAQQLRPNDSRMIVALGECYEKLDRLQEAKKCFRKAHSIGDVEGIALMKLAKLYEKLNESEHAAASYNEYIVQSEREGIVNTEELGTAFKYLSNFYVKTAQLDEAYITAQKCTEYPETREEAKALLKQIQDLRNLKQDVSSIQMDDSFICLFPGAVDAHRTDVNPMGRLSPVNLNFTP